MSLRAALLSSTAIVARWGGEFRWWLLPDELRAFGLSWSQIEREVLDEARPVSWAG